MPPTVDSASIQEIALVGRLINIAINDKSNADIQEATSTQLHLTQQNEQFIGLGNYTRQITKNMKAQSNGKKINEWTVLYDAIELCLNNE